MSEVFNISHQRNLNTRHSFLKLNQPMRKTKAGHNAQSYKGPSEWNKLDKELKQTQNWNTFKHKLKSKYL